jgi:dephospho-CoA kinase
MDGDEVNRSRLAQVVFADAAALADLEAIVHPAVTERVRRWRAGAAAEPEPDSTSPPTARPAWLAVEAVKLVESHLRAECDAIWLLLADREVRIERLAERGWSRDEVERRLDSAPALAPELCAADTVIDTSGPWDHTLAQLETAWLSLPSRPHRRPHGSDNS